MQAERRDHWRDIDGLRGIAVVLVVAFHAGVPGIGGGFIGVDVFFVISGFLITGLLTAEVGEGGSVHLATFWARRIRRLVPALFVVLTATLLLFAGFTSALQWGPLAKQGASAAVYVSNILFASEATDYFADGLAVSPFLHTWSLSVEEQFYLCWPLLFLALSAALRRMGPRGRRLIPAVLVAVAVPSFALSLLLTRRDSPWAFFSMPTRAWQFALAGLAALWAASRSDAVDRRRWPVEAAGWVGLGLIVTAAVVFDSATPYPGLAAVVPTLGALLIVVHRRPGAWGQVLAAPPLLWLGRNSYSWYLWHWPLIVAVPIIVPRAGLGLRLAAAAVALGLAELTRVLVEDPVRFRSRAAGSNRRTYALGATLTAVALVATGAVWAVGQRRVEEPSLQRLVAAREDFRLPAPTDCDGDDPKAAEAICTVGDPAGDRTVMVLGDSHAQQWIPALDLAGQRLGIRVVLRTFGGCPALDVELAFEGTAGRARQCRDYRDATDRLVQELDPDAVVLAHAGQLYQESLLIEGGSGASSPDEFWQHWSAALTSLSEKLQQDGTAVGLIHDTPTFPADPVECLARGRSVEVCSRLDDVSLTAMRSSHLAEQAAIGPGVTRFDPGPELCREEDCPVEADDVIAYKDDNHLTATRAAELAPQIEAFLSQLLG